MATTKFFLDTRRTKSGSPSVLKVAITHLRKTSYISLPAKLFPNQWDDDMSDTPVNAPGTHPLATDNNANVYRTLFNNAGAGTVSDGNVPDAFNILYNPDIPTPSDPSGVEPIIHTIDADGTHHYFDLLGRPLNHKPEQGIYIDNGKKVIVK